MTYLALEPKGIDLSKTYEGKPCRYCGGTMRWKSGRNCVSCLRAKTAKRMAKLREDPKARKRANEIRMTSYYKLEGAAYNRLRLMNRRDKAMERKRKRGENVGKV